MIPAPSRAVLYAFTEVAALLPRTDAALLVLATAITVAEAETVRACAVEVCDLCRAGRAMAPKVEGDDYLHAFEDTDETENDLYCGASPIWMLYPAALTEQEKTT